MTFSVSTDTIFGFAQLEDCGWRTYIKHLRSQKSRKESLKREMVQSMTCTGTQMSSLHCSSAIQTLQEMFMKTLRLENNDSRWNRLLLPSNQPINKQLLKTLTSAVVNESSWVSCSNLYSRIYCHFDVWTDSWAHLTTHERVVGY